ncbi:probable DNA-3-methyladenine glycosylase isoform X2 [Cryptotermes secundus]|nr:probable DNA-3-methyladenine glycosylase isoform X2 [Cryptotermes secundus]
MRAHTVSGNAKMTSRRKSERNAVKRSIHKCETETSDKNQKQTRKKQVPKRLKPNNDLNPDDILQSSYKGIRTPVYGLDRLTDSFYDVPCEDLAKGLLGKVLVRRLDDGTLIKGRIVETECYPGGEDKGSCSHSGRITETIKAIYMKPGTAFVYSTYGMYYCINISSQGAGAAVLLRALEPLEGLECMQLQRQKGRKSPSSQKELRAQDLCNGPAKLCTSFSITKSSCNEQDLTTWDGMWIQEDESSDPCDIVTSHRIGIDSVGTKWASKPFRFYLLGNASVSRRDKAREETFKQ